MTILVVNAQHIKAVPGRKTDFKDAKWIADPLRHGLFRWATRFLDPLIMPTYTQSAYL